MSSIETVIELTLAGAVGALAVPLLGSVAALPVAALGFLGAVDVVKDVEKLAAPKQNPPPSLGINGMDEFEKLDKNFYDEYKKKNQKNTQMNTSPLKSPQFMNATTLNNKL